MRKTLAPALVATALAACSAPVVASAEAEGPAQRTLVVTGAGEASAAPDLLTLSIGVETEAATASEALRQNSAQMQKTIDRLKESGVAPKDLQTSNLSVNPRYNYEENRGSPRIIGYSASNMLTVRLRDISGAGALVDAAVSDGANRLNGLSFGFADDAKLMNSAREDAVKDAKTRAETLAKAAGVTLGPILQIQEGHAVAPPMPYARAAELSVSGTPIEAGESTLSAQVTLIYSIR